MLFWTTVKVGISCLWANKLRSFLAMLGIIIGVGAVIAMLAIGAGAKQQVLARIAAQGSNLLTLTPGNAGTRGVVSGTQQTLTLNDALALCTVDGVRRLAPVINGRFQAKAGTNNEPLRVVGSSETYLPIRDFELDKGRAFTAAEVDNHARVVIVGPVTATTLFGLNDPLDQWIKIKGINFTVIGVTKSKGDQGWFNPDDQAIMPYTTAMRELIGFQSGHKSSVSEIDLQVADGEDPTTVQNAVSARMRTLHRIREGGADDFNVRNQADFINMASQVTGTFTYLLGGVASISLLVGGIGIMNIMLVTVTERTREIGIRKAIGAREQTILLQFLIETLIISGLGGLLGILAGVGTANAIPLITSNFPTHVQPASILLALGFSAAVGIFFGWYPARRAALLAPVDALRYE